MKTPDKVKKGLECCARLKFPNVDCDGCSYLVKAAENLWECKSPEILTDVIAYIQQLEMLAKSNEQIRWERDVAVDQLRQLGIGFGEKVEAQVPKWISVEERLPKNEKPVLIATKWSLMGRRGMAVSCGFYTNGKTFTCDSDYDWNSGNVDLGYDEEEDEYIVPEGWWESVRYTEQFSAVDEPVLYWMPLPEPPKEG